MPHEHITTLVDTLFASPSGIVVPDSWLFKTDGCLMNTLVLYSRRPVSRAIRDCGTCVLVTGDRIALVLTAMVVSSLILCHGRGVAGGGSLNEVDC